MDLDVAALPSFEAPLSTSPWPCAFDLMPALDHATPDIVGDDSQAVIFSDVPLGLGLRELP